MKTARLVASLVLALLSAAAWAEGTPQTAQQYRKVVAEGTFGTMLEKYEVDVAFSQVTSTLKEKSEECFARKVTFRQCRGFDSCINRAYTFVPRFTAGTGSTSFTVQVKQDNDNNVYTGGKPPAGGLFVAVADITPAGKGKTKLTVYATDYGMFAHVHKAIKHWSKGTNLGCPDFSA